MRVAAYGSTVLKDDLARVQVPQPPAYARNESEGSAGDAMIRAVIAGRSRVHSEALAAALSHGRRVQVLATASRPQEVLALVGEVTPDIVLVDFATTDAVKIVADIRRRTPNVKVVAITLDDLGFALTQRDGHHLH